MNNKLTKEEIEKIESFKRVYMSYINPNNDSDIAYVIDHIFDNVRKIYLEYKSKVPFINVKDASYPFYIIKATNNEYHLLDYLINTVIERINTIEIINDTKLVSKYNFLNRKITINKYDVEKNPESILNQIKGKVCKKDFKNLQYKNIICHEIGHAMHYSCPKSEENIAYVPQEWLSLKDFPELPKLIRNRKREEEIKKRKNLVKEQAKRKLTDKIKLYNVLKDSYNILSPEEILECNIKAETHIPKPWAICLPPILYDDPIDEAFAEYDAQIYSGMMENEIFENNGELSCFYLPYDDNNIVMTFNPNIYTLSANIAATIKEAISKNAYFNTIFLGKDDLFIELFKDKSPSTKMNFAYTLRNSYYNKHDMKKVQKLLDTIKQYYEDNSISLYSLDIYFPLVKDDDKWVYYTKSPHNHKGKEKILK